MKTQTQIGINSYRPSEGFIRSYQELIKKEVLPYQYEVLNDKAEGAEKSHVVQNFINAAKALKGDDVGDGFYGMVFQDNRQGGDEFALLYHGEIEPLLEKISELCSLHNGSYSVPISYAIGYCSLSEKGFADIADKMMYENKREMKKGNVR